MDDSNFFHVYKALLFLLLFFGGLLNLEWSNVERPIFRNFKITNIKIAKEELIDYFIHEFILYHYFF